MNAIDTGRTEWLMPRKAYTDQAWYERELRVLFESTWNLVAYTCDLVDGAVVVADVGKQRVMVSRHLDGGLEAAQANGKPCAVGVWAGMVFAHIDPESAGSFDGWLGAFSSPAWVGEFPWDELVELGRFRFPLACNWKLYIENHVDVYHLWFLHAESLGMFDHVGLTWLSGQRHWSCVESLRAGLERSRPTLRQIEPLHADETQRLRANLLWPNVPMTTSSTTVNTYQVIPTGPTTCELDLRVRGMAGGTVDEVLSAQIKRILIDEDGRACEQLQRNLASPWFATGPLAQHHERPVMLFQRDILEAVQ
jgi:choline monooxygenase